MAPTAATYGTDVTLAANAFSRSGYSFAGWSASASGGDEQLTAAEQGGTLAGEIAPSVTAGASGAPDWAPTAWGGYAKLATAAAPQAVSANARWAAGASGRLALWAAPEGSGSVELALELHLADGSVAYAQRETTTLTAGSWRLVIALA
ncbi:InlB B-repeat-containing protein [Olsenella porci]|uniref:InlB B-repeat-containing protein n=1 Tax=Olsenella porci TaxID=2652279 RepID=A0A6N7XLC2_9ACTN|nr:InlB B-repeat-containing protein [Olsenella porci]MST72028.1 InlB B-repeat-containing protein [Olsenella porci]